ncbi:MAG: apolipoprotein N-acyltransferase [Phycisphaeraceae bacterium]|nr:apolipoprotein N-acyltransferase [Phycisphaeraceae bacterium]MCW5754058.1 apolipoprotein N-acyltransferase [Phycisphaeraceae bacterium]
MRSFDRLNGPLGGLCAGMLHGACMVLAFPPAGVWPLVFVAIVPLVWVSSPRVRRPRLTSTLVAIGSLPAWMYFMHWTAAISSAGFAPLAVYLSLWPGIFVHGLRRIRRAHPGWSIVPLTAVVWTGLEFLRGEVVFHGFAWFLLGHPTIASPWLSAPGVLGGQYLVSALVAALNGVIVVRASAAMRTERNETSSDHGSRAEAFTAVALIVVYAVSAALRLHVRVAETPFRIGVVQSNVPQSVRGAWPLEARIADFETLISRTVMLGTDAPTPDVIVWPETMFPGDFFDRGSLAAVAQVREKYPVLYDVTRHFAEGVLSAQRGLGVPLIVGTSTYDGLSFERVSQTGTWGFDHRYNSAVLVIEGEIAPDRYDKMRLAPFGEEMPYISAWPWLEQRLLAFGASGMTFDLAKGARPVRFAINEVTLTTPICFEATVTSLVRRLDGDVIVNMTNDGWYGAFDGGRRHHELTARWRCVELARPLVRVANTGISGVFDHTGRTINVLPARQESHAVFEAPLVRRAWRPYAAIGNIFGWTFSGGTILAWCGTYINRRRSADVA